MTFVMEHWRSTAAGWERMDTGPAKSVWRARATADEAIAKCRAWTGDVGIPAMQVVDTDTGEVVWRDASAYPEAGPSIDAPPPAPFQTALAL